MKTILLVIALVAKADAPKADMKEAAAATAAVAVESVVQEATSAEATGTSLPLWERIHLSQAAGTPLPLWERIHPSQAAGTPLPPCEIAPAGESPEAKAKEVGVISEPRKDGDCSLIGVYAEKRLLSGPWSAKRRLEAARIRGDTDEVKRMEALLGEIVGEALEVEGTEP